VSAFAVHVAGAVLQDRAGARQVQDFGAERGIRTQAWSPIGGII